MAETQKGIIESSGICVKQLLLEKEKNGTLHNKNFFIEIFKNFSITSQKDLVIYHITCNNT